MKTLTNTPDTTFTRQFIDNVEKTYDDISVKFVFTDSIDGDVFAEYQVFLDDAKLFKVCISYIILSSGKTCLDYTLLTDIESDSFQTSNIKEFEMRVINYIKEIV